jgi:predicted metal-dependent phosphotriesterase family hydrolase
MSIDANGRVRPALLGKAQTVLGAIDAGALGTTITHEHLLMSARHIAQGARRRP